MTFLGRSRELGRLRTLFDEQLPQLVILSGLPGVGISSLVRRSVADLPHLVARCPPMPDETIRAALSVRFGAEASGPPSWSELFQGLLARARDVEGPMVVILDDAHRLVEARCRFLDPALAMLRAARDESRPLHLVLAGRAGSLPDVADAASGSEIEPASIRLGPLSVSDARPLLPGSEPWEQVRAYGVFGGIPLVLRQLDVDLTVGTNVRRLLLSEPGALADTPQSWLERSLQTPTRYLALLSTMARGEADWAALSSSVSDLTRSGQVAPYLQRLDELGWIEARRSLDAGPRSRSTRYALTDPFLAFWLRFVLPWRSSERTVEVVPHYAQEIRPVIRDHLQVMLPSLCRTHLREDALPTLGSSMREVGSLWGSEVEIPIAGVIAGGGACYGIALWDPSSRAPDADTTPLARLDRQIRETRYGFGRQSRQRLIFTGRATPTWLRREVARRHDAMLITAADLVGAGED